MLEISYEEYDRLCDEMGQINIERDGWWPSVDEIRNFIIPNMDKCIDFITYLLEHSSKDKRNKESYKLLNQAVLDHVSFVEEKPEEGTP